MFVYIYNFRQNWARRMIDRALGTQKRESYYFIFLATSVKANQINAQRDASHVKFAVYKGPQIFNQNRDPEILNWQNSLAYIHKCQLAFFLPVYDSNRKVNFTIKMLVIKQDNETEVGEYVLTSNQFVDIFLNEGNNQVPVSAEFGPYIVEFLVFTEKSRGAVDKIVKEYRLSIPPTDPHYDERRSSRMSDTPNKPRSFLGSDRLTQSRKSETRAQIASNRRLAEKQTVSPRKEPEIKRIQQPEKTPTNFEYKQEESPKQKSRPPNISHLQKQRQKVTPGPKMVTNKHVGPTQQVKAPEIGPDLERRMRASGNMTSSIRLRQVQETKQQKEQPLNWKLILFLLISLFLTYEAMAPSRKVPYKRKR